MLLSHPGCSSVLPTLPPARLPCPHRTPAAGNEAGETFTKLADVHLKLESKHDAASSWVEAAKAYLKSDRRRESCLPVLPPRCSAGSLSSQRWLISAAAVLVPSAAWRSRWIVS